MTTIAARFSTKEMAADSMCSSDDSFYLVEKLRMGKSSIYGGCGDWDKILKFYDALEKGGDLNSIRKRRGFRNCDVTVMELRSDGLWIYEGTIIPAKIKNDFWAIGTGANYAIAAMHLGLSPLEAVKVACQYDTSSTEPVDYMTLGVLGGKKTRKR